MEYVSSTFFLNMVRTLTSARLDVRVVGQEEASAYAAQATSAIARQDIAALYSSVLKVSLPAQRVEVGLSTGDRLLVGSVVGERLPDNTTELPAGRTIRWYLVTVESAVDDGVAQAAGTPSPPERTGPSKEELLREVQKFASWDGVAAELSEARARLLAAFPGCEAEAAAAQAQGRELAEALNELERLGARGPRVFDELAAELIAKWPYAKRAVEKRRAFLENKARIRDHHRLARTAGLALTSLEFNGDARVGSLSPSASWTVLIDETGENFEAGRQPGKKDGRFVAVVLPDGATLPPLPAAFHATTSDETTRDQVLQSLLSAGVGILGISLQDLPLAPGQRWVDGVLELVDWLLLLLPRSADGSLVLDVRVEARGAFVGGQDWTVAARDLVRQHGARDPQRIQGTQLTIKTYSKSQELRLGYADAVAHTWNAGSEATKARLAASQLRGRCLIEGDALRLRKLWRGFTHHSFPSPDEWAQIIADPSEADPGSICGLLSARLLEAVRDQPDGPATWNRYLLATLAHLESKAIDLQQLGRQIEWLDAAKPIFETLPVLVRHRWALARLAQTNHLGHTLTMLNDEVAELGALLVDERPPLVCEGDLHRAVRATNAFDFEGARAALKDWVTVDPRIPGLQMWGRVQSSLGQHAAFEGNHAEAIAYFDRALEAFGRLTDPRVVVGECRQTGTYRAIATMDSANVDAAQVRAAVESVVGELSVSALAALAADTREGSKWASYLVHRWALDYATGEEANALINVPQLKVSFSTPRS